MSDTPFSRGGMCSNPFGGEERIDRINLFDFLEPNAPPDKVLFCRIIQDAVSNYLYAFLGKNGTSAEEFFTSWQYFFKVVSTNKASWDHHRIIKNIFIHRGQRVIQSRYLTDSELQLMCFDRHYDLSGLGDYMHIDKFRAKLKMKRQQILSRNWGQVTTYIHSLYQHELSQIAYGQQVPLQVWEDDLMPLLVDPPSPTHLANVIYVSNRLKRPRKARPQRQYVAGMYSSLVNKIAAHKLPSLGTDWGPIATLLEGTNHDQVVRYDRDSGLCSGAAGSGLTP